MKKIFMILISLLALLIMNSCAKEKQIYIENIQITTTTIEKETTHGQTITKRLKEKEITREEKEREIITFETAETVNSQTETIEETTETTQIETTTTAVETTTVIVETAPPETTTAAPQLIYLGQYRITFYCPGSCCCGKWAGGATASGVMPQANHTIACGEDIPFGTVMHIEGLGTYVCEDRGVPSGCIDIFVSTHEEIPDWGEAYINTYIVAY